MATSRRSSALRQIRTLFSVGRVGDMADGQLLEWFTIQRAEAEMAFEELVARHGPMVLDVCRRVLRDPHDVEDAFQATFLVLVRRAGSVRDRDALGGWLHRVALRVALRAKTEAARRGDVERQVVVSRPTDSAEDIMERADLRSALHEELDRIPASYRAALVACYLEGLTHEEAASRLHWPVGTVRSRLARGRDRLRSRLARRGLAPGLVLPTDVRPPDPVPTGLRETTARSMFSDISGQTAAEKVSTTVAALAGKVIRTMNLRTLRNVAAVMLTVGTVAGLLPFVTLKAPRQAAAVADEAKPGAPKSAGAIAGVVRDTEGRPVGGATVVAGTFSQKSNHLNATTGPDGRFAFEPVGNSKKLNYVVAYKPGLAPASKLRFGDEKKGPPNGDVELTLPAAVPFVGIVQDPDGRPVAGARVRIQYFQIKGEVDSRNPILENVLRDSPLEEVFNTTTDPRGRFRFPAVPTPQKVNLAVSAEGMADMHTDLPGNFEAGFLSGTEKAPARLTIEPEARVVGRVVTKLPGVSVAGLKIGLQSCNDSAMFWRDGRTDAEGGFAFHGFPEGGTNIFLMDHPSDGPWTYRAIDNVALHPGKTTTVTIELIEGVLVEGKVADADGKPLAGESVGMYGPARPHSGAAIINATTDDKGRYRFRLPPGKTQLYITSPGPWPPPAQYVVVPDNVKTFTVPTLVLKTAAVRPKPVVPPKAASPAPAKKKEPAVAAAPGPIVDTEKPVTKGLHPFQGTWQFDACESILWYTDLKVLQKTWRWAIRGQEITWVRQGHEPVRLSFTVDPSKSPNRIDLTFLDGPDKGKECHGIYYFERGNLWICMTEPGAKVDRPTKMAMSSESKTAILILRQEKPDETVSIAGLVRDVSDRPIGGATVVGALFLQNRMIDRKIVTTEPDGRFTLKLASAKDSKVSAALYAFKSGLAPIGETFAPFGEGPPADLTLVVPRSRPFVGSVQDHDEHAIAGAEARVQRMKVPVPEGSGTTIVTVRWPVIEGTPIEGALRAVSDKEGKFQIPDAPARSVLDLAITAKGMVTHHTSDFSLPDMTGRWPAGFDDGFLHGVPNGPAEVYLDSAEPDKDALTKPGDPAPDFEINPLEGKRTRLSDLKGKVVVINFFATWCGPCRLEMPRLERELWTPYRARELVVLAIGKKQTSAELNPFRMERKLTFSIVPDPAETIFKQYATDSVPRSYVIGPDGRIVHQSMGYSPAMFRQLIDVVERELDALATKGAKQGDR